MSQRANALALVAAASAVLALIGFAVTERSDGFADCRLLYRPQPLVQRSLACQSYAALTIFSSLLALAAGALGVVAGAMRVAPKAGRAGTERDAVARAHVGGTLSARRAARLVLFDTAGRVLLFRYEDHRGSWWATPGGGVEGDESFVEAAQREAREELGLRDAALEELWQATSESESRGRRIRQNERYFLVRAATAAPLAVAARAEHEKEGILDARWWLPSEIRTTTETIFPADLAARLDGLARLRAPLGEPVRP
jgi:8-oxo-dGTP pyrophosphatase MutT (NUDIX family)